MPVMDEFKEERAAIKNGTPKQKLAYFFDYYKWYVVFGVIAIIFVSTLIHQIATSKDTAFYAMLINAAAHDYSKEAENTNAFAAYSGTDTQKYNILYDTSVQMGTDAANNYYAAQQIMVHVSAAEVDVMAADISVLLQYAYMGDFYDLRDFLTEEQLEMYKDSFYYIDGTVLEQIEAAGEGLSYEYESAYGDPQHLENMQNPIPIGILLKEECPLLQDYSFMGSTPAVSVLLNTRHPEMASRFIDFLME